MKRTRISRWHSFIFGIGVLAVVAAVQSAKAASAYSPTTITWNPPGDTYGSGSPSNAGVSIPSPYSQGGFTITYNGYMEEDSHAPAFGTHWSGQVGVNFVRGPQGPDNTAITITRTDGSEFWLNTFSMTLDSTSTRTLRFQGFRDGVATGDPVAVTAGTANDFYVQFSDPAFGNIDELRITSDSAIRGYLRPFKYHPTPLSGTDGNTLSPGDIAIIAASTITYDFSFIALADLPGDRYIYFTTRGWNSATNGWIGGSPALLSAAYDANGYFWKTPSEGVPKGTILNFLGVTGQASDEWFYLNLDWDTYLIKDQILVFTRDASSAATPSFVYAANFYDPGQDSSGFQTAFGTDVEALTGVPPSLTAAASGQDGSAFGLAPTVGYDTALKTGVLTNGMTRAQVLQAIHTPANWEVYDDDAYAGFDLSARYPASITLVGGSVNNAPTDISLSNSTVNQSGGANATVGTLSTTDADGSDAHTYTLVNGTGDTHNGSFNLFGSALRANDASALAAGNYTVRIQTDDGQGGTYAEAFSITVVDDLTPPPGIGDLAVIGWSSLTNRIRFAVLADIAAGSTLHFTDLGWTNHNAFSSQATGDGTVTWTPSAAVAKGTVLSLYLGGTAFPTTLSNLTAGTSLTSEITVSGYTIADPLLANGDGVFIYRGSSANPFFIFGFNNSSGTVDAGGWNTSVSITLRDSKLPNGTGSLNALTNGANAIGITPQLDNVHYTGPTSTTTAAAWLARIADAANWSGDDTGATNSTIGTFLSIGSANNAPTDIALSNASVNQSGGANATVGTLSTTDADGSDTHTYTLVSGTGDTDNGSFNLSGSTLRANDASALAEGSYSVRIRTDDGQGGTYEEAFSITVQRAVFSIAGAGYDVFQLVTDGSAQMSKDALEEGTGNPVTVTFGSVPIGTTTETFVAAQSGLYGEEQPDSSGNVYFVPIDTTSYNDNASFIVESATHSFELSDFAFYLALQTVGEPVTLTVRGYYNGTLVDTASTVLNADTLGTAASFLGTKFTGSENQVNRVIISADDAGSAAIYFALNRFDLDAFTPLVLNAAPTDMALSNSTVGQSTNGATGSVIGQLSTTDADGSDTHSYSLVSGTGDTHNGSFAIDGSSLKVGASALAVGSYSVRIQTDDGNGGTYAEAFTITVTDDVGPTVVSVSVPTNGIYRAGVFLDFTVSFTEPVTVLGVPALELTVGSTASTATFHSGGGTTNLVFRHTVQAGDEDTDGVSVGALTLAGGTIRDAAANDAVLTLNNVASTAGVLVDGVAPLVTSVTRKTPSQQTTDETTVVFEVMFSEEVANVDTTGFTVTPVNGGTITANVSGVSGGPRIYDVTVQITGGLGEFRLEVGHP